MSAGKQDRTPGNRDDENRQGKRPDREPPDPNRPEEPGEEIDPDACLRQYPELTSELKRLFKGLKHLSGVDDEANKGPMPGAGGGKGHVIGDYRILREIGSGGMARVFEAEQLSLRRRVALKILPPHLSLSEKAVQKFLREAEAASRSSHRGIVAIYAAGECDGIHYIAQELIEGGKSLADKLEEHRIAGALPPGYFRKAARVIVDTADALERAHTAGVIHRDIKPANILITRDGHPVISDFGLARVEDAMTLSRTGDLSGTPYYMSPEQVAGLNEAIDHRTDIYSLGVTLYETITLKRPFEGDKSHEVLKQVLYREPREPRKTNARIPGDLSLICLKAMEKDPNHRYRTMAAFATDLRRFLLGETIIARPAGPIRKCAKWVRGRKLLSVAIAASIVALVALTVVAVQTVQNRLERKRNLVEQYKPVDEALDWAKTSLYGLPGSWCITINPDAPCGYFMKALSALKWGRLGEAGESLETCIRLCLKSGEEGMEREARYLLRLTNAKQRDATDERSPAPTSPAGSEPGSEFASAEAFDLFLEDSLVWRYPEDLSEGPPWFTRPIKLNTDHFLVHLYRGVFLLQTLYKGGDRGDFETAIVHLEKVLKERPNNLTALITLGRIEYFFARYFGLIEQLKNAHRHLDHAIKVGGGKVSFMAETTCGQICLLEGNRDKAQEFFETARDRANDLKGYAHNNYRGLGDVYARMGWFAKEEEQRKSLFEKAEKQYSKAEEICTTDMHIRVSKAMLCLNRGEREEALKLLETLLENLNQESEIAKPYLMCGLIHTLDGKFKEAAKNLRQIHSRACRRSPRDLSLACLLVATFP